MRVKDDTVNILDLRDEIAAALPAIDRVHRELADGVQMVITSGAEMIKHSAHRSAHYRGDAVDIRVWHVPSSAEFAAAISAALGDDFVVIDEGSHVHVHWSPVFKPS